VLPVILYFSSLALSEARHCAGFLVPGATMFDDEYPMTLAEIIAEYGNYETAKFKATFPDGRVEISYLIGPVPVLHRMDSFDFQQFDTRDE
jgi:hypothetical protein